MSDGVEIVEAVVDVIRMAVLSLVADSDQNHAEACERFGADDHDVALAYASMQLAFTTVLGMLDTVRPCE